jgi:unsaturated chondroitin disaccharide hydrolase
MNSRYKLLPLIFFAVVLNLKTQAQGDVAAAFKFAAAQTGLMLKEVELAKAQPNAKADQVLPRSLDKDGNLVIVSPRDWCSGFFPGELWYLYEYTKNPKWLKQAQTYTAYLENEQFNTGTHDLGFEIYCSYGNGYRLTKDAAYKDVIIQGAKTLIKRFNPVVGAIKSWDNTKVGKYPVIIDNMMNLEMLFEATRLSGDSTFYKVAVTHANTTMKNHFRADYSTWHVVNYDPETGHVVNKITNQGYSDDSAWARGQAWGLYGYTMCYRETKDKRYLQQAEHIAQFLLNNPNMSKDLVPYWDYNAPDITTQPHDASAAAIMASALYELSTYGHNAKYRPVANTIVKNLAAYRAKAGENRGFILLHSTGSKPANSEIDVPIIYGDYYYLEALIRKQRLTNHQPVVKR